MSGTGDCYESAVETFVNMEPVARSFARLCHGTVTGNAGDVVGVRFGHAWVEVGGAVIDNSNGRQTLTADHRYYYVGNIDPDEVVRYDYEQTCINLLKFMHYGPW